MAKAAKLSTLFMKLRFVLRGLTAERLQKGEQALRLEVASSEQLQVTALHAHNELSFNCCSLPDDVISCQHGIDRVAWAASEGPHLSHADETSLFLQGCEPCL